MKNLYLCVGMTFVLQFSFSQISKNVLADCAYPIASVFVNPNKIGTTLRTNGGFFFNNQNGGFLVPYDPNASLQLSTIHSGGLWMGGVNQAGNLMLAAYTKFSGIHRDYSSGPLDPIEGNTNEVSCTNWDKIWTVSKEEILSHIADFQDNGFIDNMNENIFSWPGKGNPFFLQYNGFELEVPENEDMAAFQDNNQNGVYEPEKGEYPFVKNSKAIPQVIAFYIINDAGGIHTESQGNALQMEVHVTAYAFDCLDERINDVLFMNFKCTNRSLETINSFFLGIYTDFSLGYGFDDYVGCDTTLSAFYVYNSTNLDADEVGFPIYGENPPAQSVTFLNAPLSKFIYYQAIPSNTPWGQLAPTNPFDYYNYLSGNWRDGAPITVGGSGYLTSGVSTSWAMPSNPNDLSGWSMNSAGIQPDYFKGLGSTLIGTLDPGASAEINTCFSYHRNENFNHLENVNLMESEVETIREMYANEFADLCDVLDVQNPQNQLFAIFPNPAKENIEISSPDNIISAITVLSITGAKIFEIKGLYDNHISLDISFLPSGIYTVITESNSHTETCKLAIIK